MLTYSKKEIIQLILTLFEKLILAHKMAELQL